MLQNTALSPQPVYIPHELVHHVPATQNELGHYVSPTEIKVKLSAQLHNERTALLHKAQFHQRQHETFAKRVAEMEIR